MKVEPIRSNFTGGLDMEGERKRRERVFPGKGVTWGAAYCDGGTGAGEAVQGRLG